MKIHVHVAAYWMLMFLLPPQAKPLLDANNMQELVDPCLGDAYSSGEMKRATSTASMCIHHASTARPHMKRVSRLIDHGIPLSHIILVIDLLFYRHEDG